jgi:hypothetical protein
MGGLRCRCASFLRDACSQRHFVRRLPAVQDLFQLKDPPAAENVPEDSSHHGFRTLALYQTVSDQHLRAYLETAESQARGLLADATRRGAVLGCELDAAGCLRSFIERFGRVAFRRSLETLEVDALLASSESNALSSSDRFQWVMEALLTSPSFLFRVEVGTGAPLSTLSPTELASRLSFTLWGRGPSAQLLERAEAKQLETPEGLAAAAQQMLADPRAAAFCNTRIAGA